MTVKLPLPLPSPSLIKTIKWDSVIGWMSQQRDQGYSDTSRAVNFHPATAERGRQRETEAERKRHV